MRTSQQQNANKAKQFWNQIWEQKEHYRKADWINNK